VEFEYRKPIETAANAVTTELSRVRGLLPEGIREPLIFKITDAARPVMVLAVTPAESSGLDLGDVRRLAENPLRDALLNLPGVAEAEVFGGDRRQVSVSLDRDRLAAHGLSVGQVAAALSGSNLSRPAGLIHQQGNRYLLTAQTLAKTPEDLAAVLVPLPSGEHIRVGDLGEVGWGAADATSLYRGNGRPAVAVALLRSEQGFSQPVIDAVEKALPRIKRQFPTLHIEVADTQGRLIGLTVSNMLDSLRDAVIMTIFVILLFLGNTRASLVVALVLPVSYLITFAVLKAIGYEFDMVTLSAIIIAVGLLVDDAIVVIENIERRITDLGEKGLTAAINGTREILLADAAGTATTVLVLIPIMFIGGYVQQVLRPLTVTLSIALVASLVASVTLIPLLAPWIVRPGQRDPLGWLLRPFDRFVTEPLKRFYLLGQPDALPRPGDHAADGHRRHPHHLRGPARYRRRPHAPAHGAHRTGGGRGGAGGLDPLHLGSGGLGGGRQGFRRPATAAAGRDHPEPGGPLPPRPGHLVHRPTWRCTAPRPSPPSAPAWT